MLTQSYSYPTYQNPSALIANKGSSYMRQMMQLYQEYLYEAEINKLLIKKIETLNKSIKSFVEDRRENSFLLFCTTDYSDPISQIDHLSELSEFLLAGLSMINKSASNVQLKDLSNSSIIVMRDFAIKLIEFKDIYNDMKCFDDNDINEDSEDYKQKMSEIAAIISDNNRSVSGNSIRELLAI